MRSSGLPQDFAGNLRRLGGPFGQGHGQLVDFALQLVQPLDKRGAPKGGTLQLQNPDRRSSFDKFNPYTINPNIAVDALPLANLDGGARAVGPLAARQVSDGQQRLP